MKEFRGNLSNKTLVTYIYYMRGLMYEFILTPNAEVQGHNHFNLCPTFINLFLYHLSLVIIQSRLSF